MDQEARDKLIADYSFACDQYDRIYDAERRAWWRKMKLRFCLETEITLAEVQKDPFYEWISEE